MRIEKHGRFFAVYDDEADLVCICVYRKGAMEVIRRLGLHQQISRCKNHIALPDERQT